jgi:hypothetical protein
MYVLHPARKEHHVLGPIKEWLSSHEIFNPAQNSYSLLSKGSTPPENRFVSLYLACCVYLCSGTSTLPHIQPFSWEAILPRPLIGAHYMMKSPPLPQTNERNKILGREGQKR